MNAGTPPFACAICVPFPRRRCETDKIRIKGMRFRAFRSHKSIAILLTMALAIALACGILCLVGTLYLDKISHHSTAEEIFSLYLTYPDNDQLLRNAANIQATELSMGGGVYVRFEADKELVFAFLDYARQNPYRMHYPYVTVPCREFLEAYPAWADIQFKWWTPRKAVSSKCYVTKECEYFLFDNDSRTVYYYFYPDFLGKRFYCVNPQGERDTIRR